MPADPSDINKTIDQMFRRSAGQIVATLTRILGTDKIDLAEAVVQDALLKAMSEWSFQGIPEKPSAWLVKVAKNLAIDHIRREQNFSRKQSEILYEIEVLDKGTWFDSDVELAGDFKDDQLKMIFVSCHPSINAKSQIALTLKVLSGLSVDEIAKAFLAKKETIEQRIVRAKQKIKAEGLTMDFPDLEQLDQRLDAVLQVLYLMFNEGYVAYQGSSLINKEICAESIRLLSHLVSHPSGRRPKSYALLALLLFQSSRLNARTDKDGDIILLKDQDRSSWDSEAINAAMFYLNKAACGETLSSYHLEAGIASCHALAKAFDETNWDQIISYYESLLDINSSPVVFLNYAVAISERDGAKAGLKKLSELQSDQLNKYYLYHATRGELLRKTGAYKEAIRCLEKAKDLTQSEPEKKFIANRILEANLALAQIAKKKDSSLFN